MAIGITSLLFVLLFIVMNPTFGVLFLMVASFIFGFGAFSLLPVQN